LPARTSWTRGFNSDFDQLHPTVVLTAFRSGVLPDRLGIAQALGLQSPSLDVVIPYQGVHD
jgi:hypothetical protein